MADDADRAQELAEREREAVLAAHRRRMAAARQPLTAEEPAPDVR